MRRKKYCNNDTRRNGDDAKILQTVRLVVRNTGLENRSMSQSVIFNEVSRFKYRPIQLDTNHISIDCKWIKLQFYLCDSFGRLSVSQSNKLSLVVVVNSIQFSSLNGRVLCAQIILPKLYQMPMYFGCSRETIESQSAGCNDVMQSYICNDSRTFKRITQIGP